MNPDQAMKLQAYLDGELQEREAQAVADSLSRDAEGRALLEELRMIRTAVRASEPQVRLSESREFYWSRIEREIHRLEQEPARSQPATLLLGWLHRHLVPLSAAALVAFLGVLAINQSRTIETSAVGEIESLNEDMASISFRSESEKMTVIYLYDRPKTAPLE